jgi:proline dehydrogenase
LAREHLGEIASAAEAAGREVMLSMEDAARTDAVLAVHAAVAERHPRVGVTLQAALHRTTGDLARVLARPGRVRLVKGAYAEGADVALPRGPALDTRYLALARTLAEAAVARGRACSVATHDPALLDAVLADLAGRRRERARRAAVRDAARRHPRPPRRARRGGPRHARVLVYGREWYLYLCPPARRAPALAPRRLADAVDAMPGAGGPTDAAAGDAPRRPAALRGPGGGSGSITAGRGAHACTRLHVPARPPGHADGRRSPARS